MSNAINKNGIDYDEFDFSKESAGLGKSVNLKQ